MRKYLGKCYSFQILFAYTFGSKWEKESSNKFHEPKKKNSHLNCIFWTALKKIVRKLQRKEMQKVTHFWNFMESVYEEDAAENEGIRQFGVEDAQRYIASFRVNEVVSTLIRNKADYLHQIFGHLKNQHFSYGFLLMSHWFKNGKKRLDFW